MPKRVFFCAQWTLYFCKLTLNRVRCQNRMRRQPVFEKNSFRLVSKNDLSVAQA
jgi:hypothetical protein